MQIGFFIHRTINNNIVRLYTNPTISEENQSLNTKSAYRCSGVLRPGPRGSTSWSTIFIFFARSALIVLPVSSMSRAAGIPASLGSRWVPPAPGNRPSMTSGSPSPVLRSFTAILYWQASATYKQALIIKRFKLNF